MAHFYMLQCGCLNHCTAYKMWFVNICLTTRTHLGGGKVRDDSTSGGVDMKCHGDADAKECAKVLTMDCNAKAPHGTEYTVEVGHLELQSHAVSDKAVDYKVTARAFQEGDTKTSMITATVKSRYASGSNEFAKEVVSTCKAEKWNVLLITEVTKA